MVPDLFADAFGDISIHGGVVRIVLLSVSPTERDAEGRPVPQHRQTLLMPLDGFLQAFGMMETMMQRLEKAGVLQRRAAVPPAQERPAAPAAAPPAPPRAPTPAAPPRTSPNFS